MVHEVGQGASEAIEAPHDERVVLFGLGEGTSIQTRACGEGT